MQGKKLAAMLLTGALCMSALTGCAINPSATAATMDGVTVTLGLANFYCRYQQASVEDYYKQMLGTDDLWDQDLYGNGSTLGDSMKDSVMEQLHEMYTLQAHMDDYGVSLSDDEKAAITEAASAFLAANDSDTLEEMTADQETVEELLTLYTIEQKMQDAIYAEADTDVSDEEANMRAYSMITISTTSYTDDDGNTVEYTDDEVTALKETAETMVEELGEGGVSLEDVAANHDMTVSTGTYDADDSSLDEDVKTALDALSEGEFSDVVETDSALYILSLDSETDEEATEENRQSIIEERQSDHYNEVLEEWQTDDGWEVNEKNVAKISFKNALTQTDPNASTETETETETATESVESTQ